MDARSASHVLSQIAVLLELHDDDRIAPRLLQSAARTLVAHARRDLRDVLENEPTLLENIAPQARDIINDLADKNSSALLETLEEQTPEGLLEMLRVPGLGPARIRQIHEQLGIETLQDLEQAAKDGRLSTLPRFGEKSAERVLRGVADLRATGAYVLWQHGFAHAERLRHAVRSNSDVLQVEIAGSVRRRSEVVRDVDLVVAVRGAPSVAAASIASSLDVREVLGGGGRTITARLDDGVQLDLTCTRPEHFATALWRGTGSERGASHRPALRYRQLRREGRQPGQGCRLGER